MSDSVSLADLSGARIADDGVRRDRWGRYLVVPPEGGAPVPYRRATTVAKALDSEGALVPWAQSRVMLGLLRDSGVLRRLRALVKVSPDPWYDAEHKAAMKVLAAEAATAGGAEEKRDRGTWLHGCAERSLRGLDQLPAFSADDAVWLAQYLDALDDYGVTIDPLGVEAMIVHDSLRIAGKADYLRCSVPGFRLPLLGDLKTGDSLEYALHGFVVQLAVYVHADALYTQGAALDGSEDKREPMPEVDHERALLIHAPQNGAPVTFYTLDVAAGFEAFNLALQVEAWRQRTDLVDVLDRDLTATLAASIDAVEADAYREWLQGRIDAIGKHSELARRALQGRWAQSGFRPLRSHGDHDDDELREIEALLVAIEAQFSMPFGPSRPTSTLAHVERLFPGASLHPSQGAMPHE